MSVLSLLQPHQRERLTPAQRDDVTREQIAVTFGVLPWAAAVHLVVTLGLTLYVIPPDSGPLPRLWPFLSGVIGLVGMCVGLAIHFNLIAPTYRMSYAFLIIEFAVVGILYSSLALVLYPILDDSGDLILIAVTTSITGAEPWPPRCCGWWGSPGSCPIWSSSGWHSGFNRGPSSNEFSLE